MKKNIVHIITSTDIGGAENMLSNLIEGASSRTVHRAVISLLPLGSIAEKINTAGVETLSLNMKSGADALLYLSRLARMLRVLKPDVVHTWMYHANLLGSLATFLAEKPPVVWGLHHNNLTFSANKKSTLMVAGLCAPISHFPLVKKIISCSQEALATHRKLGYCSPKMQVIPNGFDLNRFRLDPSARPKLRASLGLTPDTPIACMVGRWDPQKDPENFIRAVAKAHREAPRSIYLMCGKGFDNKNKQLKGMLHNAGISKKVILLGGRDDIPFIMAGIDLLVLPSRGEAFPMVMGEAMACGTPCVATDVGDAALLNGNLGWIVPPRNHEALAKAMVEGLSLEKDKREILGMKLRHRVRMNFSLTDTVKKYETLYTRI